MTDTKEIKQWLLDMDEECKHEFTAVLISNAKGTIEIEKDALKFLRDMRLRILNENLDNHGYLGADILALKEVFKTIYNC